MRTRSAYRGQSIVFATMHGKEALAAPSFRDRLGANVVAPEHLDTDALGTFAGDIPRILSPRSTATVKARLGMQIRGIPRGLASEGTIRPTLVGSSASELLLFLDEERGLELVETLTEESGLPGAERVASPADVIAFARRAGFPEQGVLVRSDDEQSTAIHRDCRAIEELAECVATELRSGRRVTLMPDHRAHRSPTRADRIRRLCERMADRLATACAACAAPGFGLVELERGLLCSQCGAPTSVVLAEVHGCGRCGARTRVPRSPAFADPASCDNCNP